MTLTRQEKIAAINKAILEEAMYQRDLRLPVLPVRWMGQRLEDMTWEELDVPLAYARGLAGRRMERYNQMSEMYGGFERGRQRMFRLFVFQWLALGLGAIGLFAVVNAVFS